MAMSQKTRNLLAALGMSKEGFRGFMDRQYEATEKSEKSKREMKSFKEKKDYVAGLKQTPEEKTEQKFKLYQQKEDYKQKLRNQSFMAETLEMSIDEYKSAVEKAAEKNVDVLDYLEGVKSEQEAALQARKGPGMKEALISSILPPVGAAQTFGKIGQRYFGKKDQQTASTQASREQTAINRKTGERLVYRGGKWQPLK